MDGLPNAALDGAVAQISAVLAQFSGMRPLSPGEVATYQGRFGTGWVIPNLCADSTLDLRILLPASAPFSPARVAVDPVPPPLAWPHLEEQGLLCLLSESANASIAAPADVVVTLVEEARRLVNASVAGENIQDFEDEFTSYWERWERTKATIGVICEPRGESRIVSAWYGTTGTFVAETEDTLRYWLGNRFGKELLKKIACWPVPLIWLPRPFRPPEYPATVNALREAFQEDPLRRKLLDEALLRPEPEEKLILLGMNTRRGTAFAGLQIHKVPGLTAGFRKRPPDDILLTRYNAAAITGARVVRFDSSWVHGRDHNTESRILEQKRIAIIGLGSLGSSVADLLAKAGIGHLVLSDAEVFASANSARHLLGAPAVGLSKNVAVANDIAVRFPHIEVTVIGAFKDDAQIIASLRGTDLILSLTGHWPSESLLDAIWRTDATLPPVLYGWTEPHAAAGHAVALVSRDACLQCFLDEMGKTRLSITKWNADTVLSVPACGDLFQPYGAANLTHVHGLIAELALDFLLGRIDSSTHRVWIGKQSLLERAGGVWNPDWVSVYGDPAAGGHLMDIAFTLPCTVCRRSG